MMSFFRKSKTPRRGRLAQPSVWTAGIRSFTFGGGIVVLLWLLSLPLLPAVGHRFVVNLSEGQRAPVTVIAVADFHCEDINRTAMNRQQAMEAACPVFSIQSTGLHAATRAIGKLAQRVAQTRLAQGSEEARRMLADAMDLMGIPITPDDALALFSEGQEDAWAAALGDALREITGRGIILEEDRNSAFNGIAKGGLLSVFADGNFIRVEDAIGNIPTPEEATQETVRLLGRILDTELDESRQRILRDMIRPWIRPNLVFDTRRSTDLREHAARMAERGILEVRKGDTLVEEGERVTAQILVVLNAHAKRLSELETPEEQHAKWAARAGIMLVQLLAAAAFLNAMAPTLLNRRKTILTLTTLYFFSILAVWGGIRLADTVGLPGWLIPAILPYALAPILTTLLLGIAAGVATGLWTGFFAFFLLSGDPSVPVYAMVAALVGALASRRTRKRLQVLKAGVLTGLAMIPTSMLFALMRGQALDVMLIQAAAVFTTALTCALLATLLAMVFELLTGSLTHISLLEWTDLGHPLLQRLAIEAPGTYHHSITVANLSVAAADAIGADDLLLRVAGYFHDIGKLTKPQFFTENQPRGENPHDDLAPSMSRLVLQSHVREGLELARAYKVPDAVIRLMAQHHGTSMVSFFYQLARQRSREEARESDFRYPGPRPSTREAALLMLADSVEAASRSLERVSPARIETLVHEVINRKLEDDQLDEAPLTLAELTAVRKALVFTLTNMLHGRTGYIQDENKHSQPADVPANPPGTAEGARSTPAESGGTDGRLPGAS